jgi:hypothetical protein
MAIPEHTIEIPSHDTLIAVLDEHGVPYDVWGEDGSRTTTDLYEEIREGESALFVATDGLQRYGTTVKVDVYHSADAHLLHLVEEAQHNRITDTWRRRGLHNSLSEKRRAMHGEEPEAAALRGLREELQDRNGKELMRTPPHTLQLTSHRVWPSQQECNYAGLPAINETHYYVAQLRPEQYDPSGYVERKVDRRGKILRETFFLWEMVV